MNTDIYKNKLEEEKTFLLEKLSSIGVKNEKGEWQAVPDEEEVNQEVQDEADLADRASDYEERSSLLNSFQKKLADVEKALDKIKKGNYGICEICGSQIEEDRLEINPSAKTCKKCLDIKV